MDLSHAYRFAPPTADLLVATLRARGAPLAEAFHVPVGQPNTRELDVGLAATGRMDSDGTLVVPLKTPASPRP